MWSLWRHLWVLKHQHVHSHVIFLELEVTEVTVETTKLAARVQAASACSYSCPSHQPRASKCWEADTVHRDQPYICRRLHTSLSVLWSLCVKLLHCDVCDTTMTGTNRRTWPQLRETGLSLQLPSPHSLCIKLGLSWVPTLLCNKIKCVLFTVTFSSWAVMSSRLKLEARAGLPCCPAGALMVPAGDALVLLLLLLAPLLPPPPLTLLLPLPAAPLLPPAGCWLLLRPAGGFWRTWRDEKKESVSVRGAVGKRTASDKRDDCAYLGIGYAQTGHATRAVWFGVDGAEFLFDGAEVGHESIQIHILPLIQGLCRDRRMWGRNKEEEAGMAEQEQTKVSDLYAEGRSL